MKVMLRLLLFFLLFASPVFSDAPQLLTFHELRHLDEKDDHEIAEHLNRYNGREISIKGFLYEEKEGKRLLCCEPDLKSCCLGSAGKVTQQIVVTGDLPQGRLRDPVVIHGVFSVAPVRDVEGRLIQVFKINNATVVQSGVSSLPPHTLLLGALGLAAVGWAGYDRYRKGKKVPR